MGDSKESLDGCRTFSFRREIDICGRKFYIRKDDGEYFIFHNKWSLSGHGKTPTEAASELIKESLYMRESYCRTPIDELSLDAIEFRDFLTEWL